MSHLLVALRVTPKTLIKMPLVFMAISLYGCGFLNHNKEPEQGTKQGEDPNKVITVGGGNVTPQGNTTTNGTNTNGTNGNPPGTSNSVSSNGTNSSTPSSQNSGNVNNSNQTGTSQNPGQPAQTASSGDLTITVNNLRSQNGLFCYSLFSEAKGGFPDKKELSVSAKCLEITARPLIVKMNLPLGKYAISTMHDENRNDKLDKNFLGIPTEDFGFSQSAKVKGFSPPSFSDAAFEVKAGQNSTTVSMGGI